MQDLLAHNPVGLLEIDSELIIKLANLEAERIFRYEAGGLAGVSIDELIPDSQRLAHRKHVAQFTQLGTSRMMGNTSGKQIFKAVRKDGTTAHIQIGINLIKRDTETVYVIAVSDCDELHHLTEDLKRSNLELQTKIAELEQMKHKKNHFMTVMSHELRTPLQSTLGLIELLHQDIESQTIAPLLEDLNACAFDMQRHVRTLTDYANCQQGKLELQIEECGLKALITSELNRVKKRFKYQAIEQSVDLRLPDHTKHRTDVSRLASMLHGLLCNVYIHSQASQVLIRANLENSGARELLIIDIIDNGVGIPDVISENIDQPFANFQRRRSNGQGGLGVGLYLHNKYMQAMKGSLTLSNPISGGTQVQLQLPVEPATPSDKLQGLKILLVEDDKLIAKITRTLLHKAGAQVQLAQHGAQALELVHAQADTPFDLVLMDLDMPVMNGFEATRALRKLPAYASTPILAVTAGIESEAFPQALACGINHCFSKPFSVAQLQAWLHKQHA